ncbi:beta-hydroxyacid dehydrogenase, 3-hydroxyisobutyrate dehydrogenase [Mycolicibacterium chubuense NBB4]|uniref:Beta-hydroxyacid dehydrogenase, 3-hydroxyisobutyrate dehydrogenase n=1 Tax=Mycolicibacterium chubuense (strain NBB4) TaxID=710421 RepID=I4BK94_MYCCN|nr:NAD(P)-dependent oxidoreductase [Mycolicibacterium chubuense]AFM17701.1 beta-hydroxyacid dehydrogenase, 3-hydroxyisobutyrate dehydrogenase [Mycolicibacterium chubuense NBB4]
MGEAQNDAMRVTVLGTGAMGAGMAKSLLREGFDVTVWNRTVARSEPLADDGAMVALDPVAAVAEADVVLAMLFDAAATLDVMASALPHMQADAVFVQCATVGVEGAAQTASAAAEHGVHFLDCPVLGTKAPAEQGKLVMLASGDPALRERVQPAFDAVGTKTIWVGAEPGLGSRLKLACNAWIASIAAAAGQSLALARSLGVDQQLVLDALDGSAANSQYLQMKGAAIIEDSYAPQFSVDGVRKDAGLIRDALTKSGVSTALIDGVRSAFDAASSAGHGDDDMAAVYFGF